MTIVDKIHIICWSLVRRTKICSSVKFKEMSTADCVSLWWYFVFKSHEISRDSHHSFLLNMKRSQLYNKRNHLSGVLHLNYLFSVNTVACKVPQEWFCCYPPTRLTLSHLINCVKWLAIIFLKWSWSKKDRRKNVRQIEEEILFISFSN